MDKGSCDQLHITRLATGFLISLPSPERGLISRHLAAVSTIEEVLAEVRFLMGSRSLNLDRKQ